PADRRGELRHTSGFVELRGLEPLTPTLPVWCATSCAIAPYSGRSPSGPADFANTGRPEGNSLSLATAPDNLLIGWSHCRGSPAARRPDRWAGIGAGARNYKPRPGAVFVA